MSYIGNTPISVAFLTDTFSGTGSQTAFTMTVAPANTSSILVAVTGVVQDPSTYSVSGTTLTFSAAPPSGTSNISVRYLGIPASGVTTTAYRTVTDTTATAGQTSFTIASYTVGYVDVFRNGVRLAAADFTATTGTTVVLGTAATAGDTITTISFYVSSVLNAIPNTPNSVSTYNLPAGTVLQVQRNQVTGRTTGANTFPYTTSALGSPSSTTGSKYLEVSFTPISATSLILIQVYCSALSEQTNTSNAAAAGIWKNNTGAPLTVWYALNLTAAGGSPPGGVNSAGNINMMYTETSGSTTTRTYSWYAGVDGGAGLINSIGSDTSFGGQMSSIMTVTEIAQ